jgi:hypothetical protein
MKRFFSVGLLVVSLLLITQGCSSLKLSPNGFYKGDTVLYSADKAINDSYELLHKFVKWEFDNRVALEQYPEIKEIANKVREEAPGAISAAILARDLYELNKSPENKDKVLTALQTLKLVLGRAQLYLN